MSEIEEMPDFSESPISKAMNYAGPIVNDALKEGMITEVVVWALDSMKSNPDQSIEMALYHGYSEWVK